MGELPFALAPEAALGAWLREAEREMEAARSAVAGLLGAAPDTLTFTSGGTEANNLAIFGAAAAKARGGRHIVTTAMEHPSVAAACGQLEKEGW